jgi:hypothetical protein
MWEIPQLASSRALRNQSEAYSGKRMTASEFNLILGGLQIGGCQVNVNV